MRVTEIILDLQRRFPRSPIEAWQATYVDALGRFEGDALATAYRATIREWSEPGPPKPAHILASVRTLPKPDHQEKRKPWEIASDRVRARGRELYAMACREVGADTRAPFVCTHLYDLASFVARLESKGRTIGDALAYANGRDRRPGYPRRSPDVWLDDADLEIFAKRVASQSRIAKRVVQMRKESA